MDTYDKFLANVQNEILTPIITLLAIIAFAVFVWGVVQMIAAAGDEEKRTTGQRHIVWGIVGLFILFGASSIVSLLSSTINSVK